MTAVEPMLVVWGRGAEVALYEDRIEIQRRGLAGFLTHPGAGRKVIWLDQISEVRFKDANWVTNGCLQLSVMGGKTVRSGIVASAQDENAVFFARGARRAFDDLYGRLMAQINVRKAER